MNQIRFAIIFTPQNRLSRHHACHRIIPSATLLQMDSQRPLACALAGYLMPLYLNNILFRVATPLPERPPSGSYGRQNVIGMCTSLLSAGFRLAGKFAFLNQNVNLHLRRGLQESPATALTVNGWQAYRQQFYPSAADAASAARLHERRSARPVPALKAG